MTFEAPMSNQYMVLTLRVPYALYREFQIMALDRRTKPSHLFAQMFEASKTSGLPSDPRGPSPDDHVDAEVAK